MNVLNYAAAAGLTALIVYLMSVGNAMLLPFVIAVFAWSLLNALSTATRAVRIRSRTLPNNVRLGAAIVILLGVTWFQRIPYRAPGQ